MPHRDFAAAAARSARLRMQEGDDWAKAHRLEGDEDATSRRRADANQQATEPGAEAPKVAASCSQGASASAAALSTTATATITTQSSISKKIKPEDTNQELKETSASGKSTEIGEQKRESLGEQTNSSASNNGCNESNQSKMDQREEVYNEVHTEKDNDTMSVEREMDIDMSSGDASASAAVDAGADAATASDRFVEGDEELRAYEASAKMVAEKVQRQQEGKESAMLDDQHKDERYLTVDEIQALLDDQRADARKAMGGQSSGRGIMSTLGLVSDPEDSLSEEAKEQIGAWYEDRSRYVPLRLEYKERTRLRLVHAIMRSSDYANVVDGREFKTETKRLHSLMKCVGATLVGIATSYKYDLAQQLVEDRAFSKYKATFTRVFEVGRRYKVMNPEKMRGTYGKMIYLLQDSMIPEVRDFLEFDLVAPMQTVYSLLKSKKALAVLRDEYISTATMEILPDGKSRQQIQREIKLKEHAIDLIARKYSKRNANTEISEDEIKRCLYSIGDNTSYLNSNCKPIDYIITLLKKHFGPKEVAESKWSLAIYGGESGSRLTHTHERQYYYVLQSLTLWREIVHDMFRLWSLAEGDLLDPDSPYKLRNTGQGINRLQPAPRTSKAMHGILYAVQQRLGHTVEGWVGSSVIHLGDTNVPNALLFIDKYNQVPRILNALVSCLKYIANKLPEDPALEELVEARFGSVEDAIKTILQDFFKRAFDGSGADNFFEAGSCIDGRLTSAWNWCHQLPESEYFFLFKLAGFKSFDGDFSA